MHPQPPFDGRSMQARTLALLGLTLASVALSPAAATETLHECERRCELLAPKAGCQPEARTVDLQRWIGKELTGEDCRSIRRKLSSAGLCAKVILRPNAQPGVLLTTNPHPRHDARVCRGHEVRLYVGVRPWIDMPDLAGQTAANARRVLAAAWGVEPAHANGTPLELRCMHNGSSLDPFVHGAMTVQQQWPAAGERLYGLQEARSINRLSIPRQLPVVWVAGPAADRPATVSSLTTRCVAPASTAPERVIVRTTVRERPPLHWFVPALTGIGAAAAAVLLLRNSGTQTPSPSQPRQPGPLAQRRVVARVRSDLPVAAAGGGAGPGGAS